MRLQIGGKVYAVDSIDSVTLRDILVFDEQVADAGLPWTWDDVERITKHIGDLDPKAENSGLPRREEMLLQAVMVWIAMRSDGSPVTFDEAISRPVSSIVRLPDPGDKKQGSRPPTKGRKAPKKRSSPKVSPPAAEAAAVDPLPA